MPIGIMGAMPEEVALVVDSLSNSKATALGGRTYSEGSLYGEHVTVAFSGWGKVASASTATTLIQQFGCDQLIFTGVAGAVHPSLNIGDIVVANGLYQHDMDARPIFDRFVIPIHGTAVMRPPQDQVARAYTAALEVAGETKGDTAVHCGLIASGDQFIRDPLTHDGLKVEGESVYAVEMEGAAVAQVCEDHGVPYTVIRTISDKADKSASIDFTTFIKEIASHYSLNLVQALLRSR